MSAPRVSVWPQYPKKPAPATDAAQFEQKKRHNSHLGQGEIPVFGTHVRDAALHAGWGEVDAGELFVLIVKI